MLVNEKTVCCFNKDVVDCEDCVVFKLNNRFVMDSKKVREKFLLESVLRDYYEKVSK